MIVPFKGVYPRLGESVFVAPGAMVVGDVELGDRCSVWYNAVIRGDVSQIRIGQKTNVQDGAVLHVARQLPLIIGSEVVIGHNAVLQGCEIGDRVLIGMGAVVLDGSVVGSGSIIAAGSVITPRSRIPSGSLVTGVPGRVVRRLEEREISEISLTAERYLYYADAYRDYSQVK